MSKRLRLVLEYDGKLKRILSVRETSKGELLITTHVNGLLEPDIASKLIVECRHLIHNSKDSDENNVHTVVAHEDRTQTHRYIQTKAVALGQFQPLYVRSVIHPKHLIDITTEKTSVQAIDSYNPERCTMHYALWFSSRQAAESMPSKVPYTLYRLDYRYYTLFIAACFTASPSRDTSQIMEYVTTTAERCSPEHLALGNHVGPSEGAPALATPWVIIRDFNHIIGCPPRAGLGADLPLAPQLPGFLPSAIK